MTNFTNKLQFVTWTERLIFDLTKILLSKNLMFIYHLIAEVTHCQSLFTELKLSKLRSFPQSIFI